MANTPLKTEAIKNFLVASTHKDLADLYNHDFECQVNVAQDGGEPVQGEFKGRPWRAWTNGLQTWKPFRIPHNANSEPEYNDSPITYDLAEHAEGIGMTGWNWKERKSVWVAFDFDAIVGHSDKHTSKLNSQELDAVERAATSIPWVTVRRSTSGRGLHLYVFLQAVQTANHNEHAALARAILGQMAALTGFDFTIKVDNCGGNMWVWHRKMRGTNGLELVKAGTELYTPPTNWRDHIPVVTNKRKRPLPEFVTTELSDDEQKFAELAGQNSHAPLDDDHKKLLDYLNQNGAVWWWDADHHMLVTHTVHLAAAHKDLSLKGDFKTNSSHSSPHNCFAFPLRRGAWAVRRYTPGIQEADTWMQDTGGWTKCFLNREPDLMSASRAAGGLEHPSGGFVFKEAECAIKAASALGAHFQLPTHMAARKSRLKEHRDGRLVVEIQAEGNDDGSKMQGWIAEKGTWKRIFNVANRDVSEPEVGNYDDLIRHVVDEIGNDNGWVIKKDNNWDREPLTHVQAALTAIGVNPKDSKAILGNGVIKCWRLVNRPFQPEYPGNREWNRHAAQFRYPPSDKDQFSHPTWDKVFNHCGVGLDSSIKEHPWAKVNGITTGGDYLKCWIASVFQDPTAPLPYLFFWGPQNSGKSIFHEAVSLLVTSGYQRADAALVSQPGFNAELATAILCIIEEIDLRRNKGAYNRIKDWCTARQISIHEKNKTPYLITNKTHWIQCANESTACPIFPGDTRITMMLVPPLDPIEMIPKRQLIQLLEKEAPDFLADILKLELPPSNDRLNVPVICTEDKLATENQAKGPLERFIDEHCFRVDGEMVLFADFYDRFTETLEPVELGDWSKIRVGRELPFETPKGRNTRDGSHTYVCNLSFEKPKEGRPPKPKLVVREGVIVL